MKHLTFFLLIVFAVGGTLHHLARVDDPIIDSKADQSPFGRDEWRSMMRNHNHSPEKVMKVRKEVRSKFEKIRKNNKDAGLNKWTSLGPDKVGGRIRTIATHPTDPDILFIGAASGGIWKTSDGGNSWVPKGDLLPSLAVMSIIIHPTHPDTMYLSTGEGVRVGGPRGELRRSMPGAGIFRSFDGGNTWDLLPAITDDNMDEFYWINKLTFNPNDPSKFVAVGHYKNKDAVQLASNSGGIHYFTENGASLKISTIYENRGGFVDIEWPAGKDSILIGTSASALTFSYNPASDAIIYNSDRAGSGGFPTTQFLGRVEFGISPNNPNKVYALIEDKNTTTAGRIFQSLDFGFNWTEKDMLVDGTTNPVNPFLTGNDGNQGWYDNTIWVSPLDDDEVLIGGIELWRSIDGGDFFERISRFPLYNYGNGTSPHADAHVIISATDFSNANRRIYVGTDGGIATASNFRLATPQSGWDLINNNLSITQFYASDYRPGVGLVAGAQDNGTSYYDEQTDTWSKLHGSDGGFCAFGAGDTTFFSVQNGTFFYSPDQGATRTKIYKLTNSRFIAPMLAWDGGKKMLLAGQNLWYSETPTIQLAFTDISPISMAGEAVTALEEHNNEVWIGYSDGKVFKADFDNYPALAWQQKGDFNRPVTDITINPNNTSKIALSIGGYDDENIWLTSDGGNTWTERSNGMPALHVNKLIWHPTENAWLYAGTDMGIFATEDNGQNWNVSPNFAGISDGPVFTEVSDLQWGSPNPVTGFADLYVTTYGRGIWKTDGNVREGAVYIDQDYTGPLKIGSMSNPFDIIEDGESVQAHGQTWYFDAGTYPIDNSGSKKIILTKRLRKIKKTGTGSIIIGEN